MKVQLEKKNISRGITIIKTTKSNLKTGQIKNKNKKEVGEQRIKCINKMETKKKSISKLENFTTSGVP